MIEKQWRCKQIYDTFSSQGEEIYYKSNIEEKLMLNKNGIIKFLIVVYNLPTLFL